MATLDKLRSWLRDEGPRGVASRLKEEVTRRLHDRRTVLILTVDLTEPKHRLRERDRASGDFADFELAPFDGTTLGEVLSLVRRYEPRREASVRQRYVEGARGYVARRSGSAVGYVFFTEGTGHDGRLVHSDLRWLGVRPGHDELYVFDYFLIEPARGIGALFVRSVQEEHYRLGYRAAYGFVVSTNRAAAWLYRTTGWVEVARVEEHRVLSRFALVGGTVYSLGALSRRPLFDLPRP